MWWRRPAVCVRVCVVPIRWTEQESCRPSDRYVLLTKVLRRVKDNGVEVAWAPATRHWALRFWTVGWEETHGELCIHFVIPAGGTDYYHTDSSKTGSKTMTVSEEIYLGQMFSSSFFSLSFQGCSVHMVDLDDVHIQGLNWNLCGGALPGGVRGYALPGENVEK